MSFAAWALPPRPTIATGRSLPEAVNSRQLKAESKEKTETKLALYSVLGCSRLVWPIEKGTVEAFAIGASGLVKHGPYIPVVMKRVGK